ncbi:MAG: hypothetical protein QXS20_07280 [Candidatus Thorarchaeota archaeon]
MTHAILMVGSPRTERSSSNAIADYLGTHLREHGVTIEKLFIHRINNDSDLLNLSTSIASSDIVVLCAPLYVDSLPAPVLRILQRIAADRTRDPPNSPLFGVVINCGYPEASQCTCAIEICRLFASRAHLRWAGGIAFGAGPSIGGRPLEQTGGATRFLRPALERAAEALASGVPIPDDAITLAAKPILPSRLYSFIVRRRWLKAARHHGVDKKLDARPFAP